MVWRRSTRTVGALAVASVVVAVSTLGGLSSGRAAAAATRPTVKLGLLWQVRGEGPYGENDYQNGALLAIRQVNAAGGVDGAKVTWFREAVSPTDDRQALHSYRSAAARKPAAMVGLVAPAEVRALAASITRRGIPVLATTTSDPSDAYGAAGGSKDLWFIGAYNPALAAFGTSYLVDDLGLTTIGLMGTDEPYGTGGMAAAAATLRSAGLKPYATIPYSPTATGLTPQVLAMKGAGGIVDWGYPNTIGVQLNQLVQNGISIPTMAPGGVDVTVSSGLAQGQALAHLYASQACDLASPGYSTILSSFAKAFEGTYHHVPSENAAWAYDGVKVAVAAVRRAGHTSPGAVNAALAKVRVPGACSAVYRADPAHFMARTQEVSKFSTAGTSTVVKVGAIPPVEVGG